MSKPIGNLVILFVLAILTSIYFFDVQTLPNKEERIVVETLFYILLFLMIIEAIKSIISVVKDRTRSEDSRASSFTWGSLVKNKQGILFISLVVYVLGIPVLGFFVTSFIYMIFLNYFLKNRKKWQIFVIPVLVLTVCYLLFVQILNIRLPAGIFL